MFIIMIVQIYSHEVGCDVRIYFTSFLAHNNDNNNNDNNNKKYDISDLEIRMTLEFSTAMMSRKRWRGTKIRDK